MFTLAREHRFSWPVSFEVPMDNGTRAAQGFTARFRLLPQSRIEDLSATPQALMAEALIGWEGIREEHGGDLPFSPEAVRALLDVPYILVALATAYADAVSGAGPRKN